LLAQELLMYGITCLIARSFNRSVSSVYLSKYCKQFFL